MKKRKAIVFTATCVAALNLGPGIDFNASASVLRGLQRGVSFVVRSLPLNSSSAFQRPSFQVLERRGSFGLRENFHSEIGFEHRLPKGQFKVGVVAAIKNAGLGFRHKGASEMVRFVQPAELAIRAAKSPLNSLQGFNSIPLVWKGRARSIDHFVQFFRRIHCGHHNTTAYVSKRKMQLFFQ
jgi:hypothetical protein